MADQRATFWHDLGAGLLGPLLEAQAGWLHRQTQSVAINRLYFLARDTRHLLTAYEALRRRGAPGPEGVYLPASRRAYQVAAIDRLTDADLAFLCSGVRGTSRADFLRRLGWDPDAATACAELPAALDQPADRARAARWLRARESRLLAQAAQERQALWRYLHAAGWPEQGPVGLADIGWNGSLQHALHRISRLQGGAQVLHGWYFGLLPRARQHRLPDSLHAAWAFLYGSPAAACRACRHSIELVEFLNSHAEPGLDHFRIAADGTSTAQFGRLRADPPSLAAQEALAAGLGAYLDSRAGADWQDPPAGADPLAALWRLLTRPTLPEAEQIGDIIFDSAPGGDPAGAPLACPRPDGRLLPLRALLDGDRRSFWRAGFRRRCPPPLRWLLACCRPAAKSYT
jgi:hypothetical protein